MGKHTGSISQTSVQSSLSGTLSSPGEKYDGTYQVTPKAYTGQVLNTAGKTLTKNITVNAVPYSETSNKADGITVYIAEE